MSFFPPVCFIYPCILIMTFAFLGLVIFVVTPPSPLRNPVRILLAKTFPRRSFERLPAWS